MLRRSGLLQHAERRKKDETNVFAFGDFACDPEKSFLRSCLAEIFGLLSFVRLIQ